MKIKLAFIFVSLLVFYGCQQAGTSSGTVPADVQAIFTNNCVGCHGDGGTAPNLKEGKSYASLVNVDSTTSVNVLKQKGEQITATKLVAPGDPAGSWLSLRLFGDIYSKANEKILDQMPLNPAIKLNDGDQRKIAIWIQNLSGAGSGGTIPF